MATAVPSPYTPPLGTTRDLPAYPVNIKKLLDIIHLQLQLIMNVMSTFLDTPHLLPPTVTPLQERTGPVPPPAPSPTPYTHPTVPGTPPSQDACPNIPPTAQLASADTTGQGTGHTCPLPCVEPPLPHPPHPSKPG